jgi:hypothetical protein
MIGTDGLTRVRTEHLIELLRRLHRGTLEAPFDQAALARAGFLGIADELHHLRGLDQKAVTAVVLAVLAERRRRPGG